MNSSKAILFYETKKFKYTIDPNAKVVRYSKSTGKVRILKLMHTTSGDGSKSIFYFYSIDGRSRSITKLMLEVFYPQLELYDYKLMRINENIIDFSLKNLKLVEKNKNKVTTNKHIILINCETNEEILFNDLNHCASKMGYSRSYLYKVIREHRNILSLGFKNKLMCYSDYLREKGKEENVCAS